MTTFEKDPYLRSLSRRFNQFMRRLQRHPPTNRMVTVAFLALISISAAYSQHQVQAFAKAKRENIALQNCDGHTRPIVQLGAAGMHEAIFMADSTRQILTDLPASN